MRHKLDSKIKVVKIKRMSKDIPCKQQPQRSRAALLIPDKNRLCL